ncbi:MAG TPA: HAD-IA family hydrolase [Candidatus Acidoferrum sp.]|jgi:sugar-phosphatase
MTEIACRGLLLDMDGVLVDSTPAVARVWSRWAEMHGLDAERVVKQAHGRPSLATIVELLPDAGSEVHRRENHWMEQGELADFSDVIALPGTKVLLSALPPSQVAVVTSAIRALAEVRLRAAGLLPYVQNMVTADDIHRGKPDPEPYLKGAAKLNLPASDCVVIEDAPSGVRSGKAAGARVLALRTTTGDEELLAAGADWIANDCASLRIDPKSSATRILLQITDDSGSRRLPKMS